MLHGHFEIDGDRDRVTYWNTEHGDDFNVAGLYLNLPPGVSYVPGSLTPLDLFTAANPTPFKIALVNPPALRSLKPVSGDLLVLDVAVMRAGAMIQSIGPLFSFQFKVIGNQPVSIPILNYHFVRAGFIVPATCDELVI